MSGPADASTGAERLAGFAEALETEGLAVDPDLVVHGAFSRRSGYEAAVELLGRTDRPDGIVAACDQQAIGVLQACHRLGVVVPDDVAVIGFDDVPEAAFTVPALSTVSQPLDALAAAALDIVTRATPPPADGRPVRIPVQLRTRESCGCTDEGALS